MDVLKKEAFLNTSNSLAQSLITLSNKSASIDWNGMQNAALTLSNAFSEITKSTGKFAENITKIITAFSEQIKQIHLPGYSDEEKKNFIEAFRLWGSYGWTPPPDMPFYLFASAPQSQKAANSEFDPYCRNSYLYSLFEKIASESRVHLSDFNVAKQCFLQRNYKSCAQMLFSLIDGVYLRIQPPIDKNNQWRKAGERGVTRLKGTLDKSTQEQWFFSQLLNINLISCLYTLYESYPSFQNEPQNIINRNFIMHGMGHRKVLRRDCVQLFFLYYNMLIQTRNIPYRRKPYS